MPMTTKQFWQQGWRYHYRFLHRIENGRWVSFWAATRGQIRERWRQHR